jgi:hypothetical protein
MTDHDDDPGLVPAVADEITRWQHQALTLPLAEASFLARDGVAHLGCVLNDFNQARNDGQADEDALARAVGDVVRQATMAAIYTLAVTHRTREAAAYS